LVQIASLDDPRIAAYRLTASPADLIAAGLFIAEGRLVVERLLRLERYAIHSVLVTPPALGAIEGALASRAAPPPVFVIDQPQMNTVVGFNIHRGCLALAERPARETLSSAHLATARRIVVLEGVNNPDNVGGIFRSAAAFGVDLVVLGPGCSDPLYRKAIRTSMAATLLVPFVDAGAWPNALDVLRDAGFSRIALTPAVDAISLGDMTHELSRVALMIGAEGDGLTGEALAHADRRVRIPIASHVDSLNATVAASIALHHFR
jgi:tRNA G18 (ribose-2'-O)-methylase SpoU